MVNKIRILIVFSLYHIPLPLSILDRLKDCYLIEPGQFLSTWKKARDSLKSKSRELKRKREKPMRPNSELL